ncbi:CDP-diacylglycerol--glycerol-3-phosphate 3-phosphatidyltransferase [Anoxybacter fermentans]|uniref:CDP-diacylglycerol--glycerol-3-phosphate 3-phosphatidyltransferase n=1 Tax=Anoxybacter fermentans TaxID=1323375 RepID=A0A3S9SWR1_9FIRM|nr:CDP-diacylglycerol--glycerol-3-phosphate 3-phosphatidyltransferase [Anoxybacter fermentans]AZR72777.1 CDP-diacylglycerol--glycerol-3-phosphate 3-phosphatidyltransferase [Anoxybacter fermentans]
MNLANALTTSRILFIPLFLYFFFADFPNHYLWAGGIFVFSGITDLLDGYIARTRNLTSRVGRLLDPLADKLSMISAFISLAIVEILPLWIIMIILVREVTILSGSVVVYLTGHDIIFPSRYGKWATFTLYCTAVTSILSVQFFNQFFLTLAIPLTLLSGIDYIIKAYRYFFKKASIR